MPRKKTPTNGTIIQSTPEPVQSFKTFSVGDLTQLRTKIDEELSTRLKELDAQREAIVAAIQVEVERPAPPAVQTVREFEQPKGRAPKKRGFEITNSALVKAIRQSGKFGASRSEIAERIGLKGSPARITTRLVQLHKQGRLAKTGERRSTRWTVTSA